MLTVVGGSLAWAIPPAGASTLTVTSTADSGAGSLREALANANDGDVIDFALAPGSTIDLTGGQLEINDQVTLDGPGAAQLDIDAGGSSRVFYVYPGAPGPVTISGLTITGGDAGEGSGGGIESRNADLTLDEVEISGNSAGNGGGVEVDTGTLTVTDSVISGNTALDDGGGIYVYGRDYNDVITGNDADVYGVSITDTTLSDNTAGSYGNSSGGGASIVSIEGPVTLTNVTVQGNAGKYGGGLAIGAVHDDVTITNSTIGGNAEGQGNSGYVGAGAAIGDVSGTTAISGTTFTGNDSSDIGGGLFLANLYDGTVTGSTISGNTADSVGGGLTVAKYGGESVGALARVPVGAAAAALAEPNPVIVENSVISGNSATLGGGVAAWYGGEVVLQDSQVTGNDATTGGGVAVKSRRTSSPTTPPLPATPPRVREVGSTRLGTDRRTSSTPPCRETPPRQVPAWRSTDGRSIGFAAARVPTANISEAPSKYAGILVVQSTISGNDTTDGPGGGALVGYGGELALVNSTVSGNTAMTNAGGGIFLSPAAYAFDAKYSTIADNQAELRRRDLWRLQ